MINCYNYKKELCTRDTILISGIPCCFECIGYYNDYCENAWNGVEDEDEYRIVTREMAKDAGDLTLEGQIIKW